jgi:flagellar motility protein MotE (MotC chaperone)
MKAVFAILGVVVVLGIVYGLAFMGIIPVKKMAAKNPALAKILAPLHLAPAKPKATAVVAKAGTDATDPQQQTLDAQKKQLADDRAQLDKDKAAFDAQKQSPSPTPAVGADGTASVDGASPNGTAAADTGAKLSAIYATMSPDDIAKIFAKLPDPVVIQNLMPLDEGKAGKVLAAMPADRAARLSQQMMGHGLARQAAATPPPGVPVTTIP